MTNDAKFGLVVGLGLVIAVAVVYFRKEPGSAKPDGNATATVAGARATGPLGLYRPEWAQASRRSDRPAVRTAAVRRHTVVEGETLAALAQRYYGDTARYTAIAQANPEVLDTPGPLTPGTVLVIP